MAGHNQFKKHEIISGSYYVNGLLRSLIGTPLGIYGKLVQGKNSEVLNLRKCELGKLVNIIIDLHLFRMDRADSVICKAWWKSDAFESVIDNTSTLGEETREFQ